MFSISKAAWSILHLIPLLQCFSFRWRYMTSLGHNKLNICFWATHTDETTYKTHTSDKMITTLVCVQRHPKIVPNQYLHYMFIRPTFSQWKHESPFIWHLWNDCPAPIRRYDALLWRIASTQWRAATSVPIASYHPMQNWIFVDIFLFRFTKFMFSIIIVSLVENKAWLIKGMAWHRTGDKSLSTSIMTLIWVCVTRGGGFQVDSFTKEVNPGLAKRPLKTNGPFANLKLTSSGLFY